MLNISEPGSVGALGPALTTSAIGVATMAKPVNSTPLTSARLRELLHYDPETGTFTWLVARGKGGNLASIGSVAGTTNKQGYRHICINYAFYKAHRLAWLYMTGDWPAEKIDHINRDPGDNRFANLRETTIAQNRANSRGYSKTGYKGVYRRKTSESQWYAELVVEGRRYFLGSHNSPEKAHAAYCEAAKKLLGEFACTAHRDSTA